MSGGVAQRSDPDLAPVVRWLEASDERPSWQVVAAESPAAKCLEDWDVKLPAMLMAYRSAVHEATDHSPSQLMFGRELRLPIDLATGRPPDVDLPTVTSGSAAALQERFAERSPFLETSMFTISFGFPLPSLTILVN
ncbi:hypothetical protein O3P69_013351 [Scylla paramamosain]|uniref:Uncharacterized protein n=1 Tax=Scylla paramamosain TaxID=85552 RepID=A0AAW0TZS3_SCYPA